MEKAYAPTPGEKYEYDQSQFINQEDAEILQFNPVETSGLGLRAFAFFIDQAILIIPSIIFSGACVLMTYALFSMTKFNENFVHALCVGAAMSSFFLVHWLYFALSESSSKQATFGMSILGLKVQKSFGKKMNFYEANNRYWIWFFSTLCFGINLLGLLGAESTLIHDKVTNTYVVQEN